MSKGGKFRTEKTVSSQTEESDFESSGKINSSVEKAEEVKEAKEAEKVEETKETKKVKSSSNKLPVFLSVLVIFLAIQGKSVGIATLPTLRKARLLASPMPSQKVSYPSLLVPIRNLSSVMKPLVKLPLGLVLFSVATATSPPTNTLFQELAKSV